MGFLNTIMDEFVIEDIKVFREFDASSFLLNANSSLNRTNRKLSFEIDKYSRFLEKSILDLTEANIDKSAFEAFINNLYKVPENSLYSSPVKLSDVIVIKPKYLSEYMGNIASSFDRVISGDITKEEIDRYASGDVAERVKRQIVKTDIEPGLSLKEILKIKNNVKIEITPKYIKDKVIPFVNGYEKNKALLLSESREVLNAIRKAESDFNASVKVLDNMRTTGNVSDEIIKKLNYLSYTALRGLLDVISYTTYMAIRKITIFQSNIIACNELYIKTSTNTIELNESETVTESLKEITGVVGSTTGDIAVDLIHGHVDAYKVLSDNIYQYHTGLIKDPDVPISVSDAGDNIGYAKYDRKVYDNAIKIFIDIAQGLDIIAASSDEYMLVFDNIVANSGFVMDLVDRFKGTLDSITDTSNYASASLGEYDAYQKILLEIKDFPNNMQTIADTIMEDKIRMENLAKRFEHDINGEFKNAEAISELKVFIASLTEQYNSLINILGTKFLERLRTLGLKADEYNGVVHNPAQAVDDGDTAQIDVIDSTDYAEMAMEEAIEYEEERTKELFRVLESQYYELRELNTKGLKLVTEAEPTVNQPQQNVNNNPNQQQSTKPVVTDNSGVNSNGSSSLSGLKDRIMKWFQEVIQKISQKARDLSNDQKVQEIKTRQQDLISRSYNNVTVNMLPYRNMDVNNISNDLTKMSNTIKNINPQVVQGIQKKEDWYSRVLSMINGGIDVSKPLNNQIHNYYKTGTKEPTQMLSIANNELKTFVSGTMLPYITGYENIINDINQKSDQVKDALSDCIDKLSTQPATESTNYFEADANVNTQTSMGQKATWLKEIVELYVGSVYNALRDRSSDYISVCHSLIPKKTSNNNQNTEGNAAEQNPTGAEQQPIT